MLKAPFYLLYKLWIGFIFWTTLLLLYPVFYVQLKRKRFQSVFQWKRRWGTLIRILIFCPLKVEWKGELPESPFIVCSNHSSYIDTVFMYCAIPEYFLFLGKGELLKWPLFRLFFRKMDIPVQRDDARKASGALSLAAEALRRGESIAIYPEGTIPWSSPKMKAFKNGAFKLAIEEQVPIVPITWQTNYKIMGEPTQIWSRSRPGAVRVVVHPTISPLGLGIDQVGLLRSSVYEVIEGALPAAKQE